MDNVMLFYLTDGFAAAALVRGASAVIAGGSCGVLASSVFAVPGHGGAATADHIFEFLSVLGAAALVGTVLAAASRDRGAAAAHQREAQVLAGLVASRAPGASVVGVLGGIQRAVGLSWVRLTDVSANPPAPGVVQIGDHRSTPAVMIVQAGAFHFEGGGASPQVAGSRLVREAIAVSLRHTYTDRHVADGLARAQSLSDIDRARGDLITAVSHDLQTPLTGIKAAASLLQSRFPQMTEAAQLELLSAIEESADQLTLMVANLLNMSRLRAGMVSANIRPVALYEVLAQALNTVGDRQTIVRVAEELPFVSADPILLERVLANLLANARRHAASSHLLTSVEAYAADGVVRVAVIDHGPGIARHRWHELFRPFQPLSGDSDGLGLGLAICKGFSEAMGCDLYPSSTPGGGLTMNLTLPCTG